MIPIRPAVRFPTALSPEAHRVLHVLALYFHGNQTKLAAAVNCTQASISRIIGGKQEPGPKVLAGIAALPGIDAQWALHGIGRRPEPRQQAFELEGLLPVLDEVVSPMTADLQRSASSEQRIVPSPDFSPSRFFLRVSEKCDIVVDLHAGVLPGDLLLIETDVSRWSGNPVYLDGRLCIVADRVAGGRFGFARAQLSPGRAAAASDLNFNSLMSTAPEKAKPARDLAGKVLSQANVVGVVVQLLRPL